MSDDGETGPGKVPRSRLHVNPEALKVVPSGARKFWERMADGVVITVAQKFRTKWTDTETAVVILAGPDQTYDEVAKDLGRTPGAVRYRRQAMVHLLREEHGAPERVRAYAEDPKGNHKQHDYHQVHETLEALGIYDLPVAEQFEIAQPLRQPTKSWRGDGTAASLSASRVGVMRDEMRRLIREAKRVEEDG